MHKLVRSLILALSVALPPSALAIAPVTNSGLEHMTTCYCYQAMMATANTCGMECGRGTIAHIGHWNGIKNSFLALKFLKMSEELGGVDHVFHQAIKTPQAEQHAALDNRDIIEQSPIINLPELDTEKLTEELGDAADEAGREADELGREADELGREADEAARRKLEIWNNRNQGAADAGIELIDEDPVLKEYLHEEIDNLVEAVMEIKLNMGKSHPEYKERAADVKRRILKVHPL